MKNKKAQHYFPDTLILISFGCHRQEKKDIIRERSYEDFFIPGIKKISSSGNKPLPLILHETGPKSFVLYKRGLSRRFLRDPRGFFDILSFCLGHVLRLKKKGLAISMDVPGMRRGKRGGGLWISASVQT